MGVLLITPMRNLLNINLIKFRRAIGLMAFFYVLAHFTVYLWLVFESHRAGPEIWLFHP